MNTPNLGLPCMLVTDADKVATHNAALAIIDIVANLSPLDKDLAAPPGSPTNGQHYIVAATATGDWTGWETRIAWYDGAAWQSIVPKAGWIAWVVDEAVRYHFNGTAWVTGPS